MVKGITKFHEYFVDYENQYVLIGGAACDISFQENDFEFRATKDLDMVLIVESLTPQFGARFWEFVLDGGYQRKVKSNGTPQFYRFENPLDSSFPAMIELFSRTNFSFNSDLDIVPIHIDDDISSLSAILLDDDYYELLLNGRTVIEGISILLPQYLIAFKAKAWLDLTEKKTQGLSVDSRTIKKHKNDVLRISMLLAPDDRCNLPVSIRKDMQSFINQLIVTENDLKNLKINIDITDLIRMLKTIYSL